MNGTDQPLTTRSPRLSVWMIGTALPSSSHGPLPGPLHRPGLPKIIVRLFVPYRSTPENGPFFPRFTTGELHLGQRPESNPHVPPQVRSGTRHTYTSAHPLRFRLHPSTSTRHTPPLGIDCGGTTSDWT